MGKHSIGTFLWNACSEESCYNGKEGTNSILIFFYLECNVIKLPLGVTIRCPNTFVHIVYVFGINVTAHYLLGYTLPHSLSFLHPIDLQCREAPKKSSTRTAVCPEGSMGVDQWCFGLQYHGIS